MTKEAVQSAVRNWLSFRNWRAKFHPERGYFEIGIMLDCTLSKVRLILDAQNGGCLVYVIPQLSCPQDRMQETARYLTLVNFGLVDGNFEMRMRSGDIRYKCFVNCDGLSTLPTTLIDSTVRAACSTFRKYANGLARVVLMSSDANQEVREIEPSQALIC